MKERTGGMENLASSLLEGGPVYRFFQGAMPKSLNRQKSLHTLDRHLMAQLPSLQEPCTVKVALEEKYQYKFD
jgi:hypothetical protein